MYNIEDENEKDVIEKKDVSPDSVGPALRQAREKLGEEIDDIAGFLRIRKHYLHSIESGSYDELPGATYVMGFIRSYAEYLGLNADRLIETFKEEQAYLFKDKNKESVKNKKTKKKLFNYNYLIYMGFLSAIIVFAYFTTTYFLEQDDSNLEDIQNEKLIKPEPDNVVRQTLKDVVNNDNNKNNLEKDTASNLELIKKQQDPQEEVLTEKASNNSENKNEEQGKNNENKPSAIGDEIQKDIKSGKESESFAADDITLEEEKLEIDLEEIEQTEQVKKDDETIKNEDLKDENETVDVSEKEEILDAELEENRTPVTYGVKNKVNSRISLKSVAPTWISLKDADTETVVFEKILYKGDEYFIPKGQNLLLTIGNAAGLEIVVDGKKIPSFGGKGERRSNIKMDPKALKNGTAYLG